MQTLSGIYDGKEIVVLYEGEGRPVHVYCRIVAHDIVRLDDTFESVSKASAFIASELSMMFAYRFLHEHNVNPKSRLWDLNHTGYPGADYFVRNT
jgi:hypothetical protein